MGTAADDGLVSRATRLRGTVRVPSDKSIAHRALIANALSGGPAEVVLRAPGDDILSTMVGLDALGVRIETERRGEELHLRLSGEPSRDATIDCGNSGTSMRLVAGLAAGLPLTVVLDGDASLRRRPMERVATLLRSMGAKVDTTDGHAPMRIVGRPGLAAQTHRLPVASAQLLGAVALAALSATGTTRVEVPGPTRDHTERLLVWMGVPIRRDGLVTSVSGPATPHPASLRVPGDLSSAAAWLVAATIHPDADLTLADLCLNPTRLAIVDALRTMGATIEVVETHDDGPEPVGELRVRSAAELRPISIGGADVSALIDELPLLAVAMAAADGESQLRDAGELRVKESDRIGAVVAGLSAIGARVEEQRDGWRVSRGTPRDARITTQGDHRVAIAFAVAGLTGVGGSVEVDDPGCASVSYPTFWRHLRALSGGVEAGEPVGAA